jgi:diaminopimelate decarboxylase
MNVLIVFVDFESGQANFYYGQNFDEDELRILRKGNGKIINANHEEETDEIERFIDESKESGRIKIIEETPFKIKDCTVFEVGHCF